MDAKEACGCRGGNWRLQHYPTSTTRGGIGEDALRLLSPLGHGTAVGHFAPGRSCDERRRNGHASGSWQRCAYAYYVLQAAWSGVQQHVRKLLVWEEAPGSVRSGCRQSCQFSSFHDLLNASHRRHRFIPASATSIHRLKHSPPRTHAMPRSPAPSCHATRFLAGSARTPHSRPCRPAMHAACSCPSRSS